MTVADINKTAPGPSLKTITPRRGYVSLDLGEIWRYRELAFFLVWRDIKVRYRQTILGGLWAVVQPLFTMVAFTVLFSKLAKVSSGDIPYPLFSYCALLPWTYFSNSLSASGNSLVASGNLITKVYFPRIIVPMSSILANLVDFCIASVVMIGLMFWYRIAPTSMILMVVPLTLLASVLALGVGLWLSALNVRYRDVRQALGFLVRFWMFATPVIYVPLDKIPDKWRWLMALNPMTGVIEGFRSAFLNSAMAWDLVGVSLAITLVVLISGVYYFNRVERTFADVV